MFQNGRASLKRHIFILLQLVIPTLKSHAATRHVTTRTCHCEQSFQDGPHIFYPCCFLRSGFVLSVLLSEFHSSHSFAISPRIAPHFRTIFCENSTGFDVIWIIVRLVSCLLCSCRVSLQPQFRHSSVNFFLIFVLFLRKFDRFSSHLYHRSLRVLLSLTPATVSPVSFRVRNIIVRFVL